MIIEALKYFIQNVCTYLSSETFMKCINLGKMFRQLCCTYVKDTKHFYYSKKRYFLLCIAMAILLLNSNAINVLCPKLFFFFVNRIF